MQARIGRLREKTGSEFNLQKVIKASSVFYLRDVALFYPELFLYTGSFRKNVKSKMFVKISIFTKDQFSQLF